MTPMHRTVHALALMALIASVVGAQATSAPATIVGTVRDPAGAPIVGAEVVLRELGKDIRSVRADARGAFVMSGVTRGIYNIWFRRLGYSSVDYNWAASAGMTDTVTATLSQLPHGLDPVVVREREDRLMKGTSSVLGLVVDTEGAAVEEASVDLVGADRGGMTRANGGFLFKPLQPGPYVVRVRKLGYAPQMVTMSLLDQEDREVVVRLRPLTPSLDAVQVIAQSGYGDGGKRAYEELDQRLRWRGVRNIVLGPEELRHYKGLPLDWVAPVRGATQLSAMRGRRGGSRSINPAGTSTGGARSGLSAEGDACVLINGRDFQMRPISSYNINEIEMLEIYASGSEDTRTVRDYMRRPCEENTLGAHPTWYVLWLKGTPRP